MFGLLICPSRRKSRSFFCVCCVDGDLSVRQTQSLDYDGTTVHHGAAFTGRGRNFGRENMTYVSRMNKAVMAFLWEERHVHQLVENGNHP